RTQPVIADLNLNSRMACRKKTRIHRISQLAASNRGDFASDTVMTPKIGAVRQALVIDVNDPVWSKPGQPVARFDIFKLKQTGVIAIDAELSRARKHTLALDAFDDQPANRFLA